MELIKSAARRSKLSDVVYMVLNLALAVLVLVLTLAFSPPFLAYLVIVLSKWRVLAVRPRFWIANLQTNMVDLLVGLSVVTMIWQASGSLIVQLLLTVLYAAWLLILKPRSKRPFILLQAGISQLVSTMALISMAHAIDISLVVAACWVIGYVCARHVLSSYEDDETTLLSMMWGYVVAEIGWLSYQWTVAYELSGSLLVPQAAIIIAILGFAAAKAYDAHYQSELSWKKIRGQVLFAGVIIAMLLLREISDIFRYTV